MVAEVVMVFVCISPRSCPLLRLFSDFGIYYGWCLPRSCLALPETETGGRSCPMTTVFRPPRKKEEKKLHATDGSRSLGEKLWVLSCLLSRRLFKCAIISAGIPAGFSASTPRCLTIIIVRTPVYNDHMAYSHSHYTHEAKLSRIV